MVQELDGWCLSSGLGEKICSQRIGQNVEGGVIMTEQLKASRTMF